MAKVKTKFVCEDCGYEAPRWLGRCPQCGQWNSLIESVESPSAGVVARQGGSRSVPQSIAAIPSDRLTRIQVPMDEFNRTLGGGIVPGSVILVGGDPGIGKSTLLLQVFSLLARSGKKVLYVSGEESVHQVKMRAERLGAAEPSLYLLSETNLDHILNQIDSLAPDLVVIDSIQAVYLDQVDSAAGSITQVRQCAGALVNMSKSHDRPTFIVGHVTKAGMIAGPRILEHMVDTVLYLEGERFHSYRLLRSVKNRFGSTNEVGVFEMQGEGLLEIANPSEAFLAERLAASTGSAVTVTLEGTRPLLIEIQALTSKTGSTFPRRTSNGIDLNRLLILVAVLSKRVGLGLSGEDVFVNVVGGMRVREPAVDLAVAAAIASSERNQPLPDDCAMIGEIGLSGELRSVSQLDRRLNEAAKLGFKRCVVPRSKHVAKLDGLNVEILQARSIGQALDLAFRKAP